MADLKISQLTPASSVGLTDLLLLTQADTSLKLSVETLLINLPSRLIVKEASETLITASALAVNKLVSKITISAAGISYTLAAGTHGMEKEIVCNAQSGVTPTGTITVTGATGFTTLTFNTLGESVKLKNIDNSWYVMSNNGVVLG